jgi:hypothetical protein
LKYLERDSNSQSLASETSALPITPSKWEVFSICWQSLGEEEAKVLVLESSLGELPKLEEREGREGKNLGRV